MVTNLNGTHFQDLFIVDARDLLGPDPKIVSQLFIYVDTLVPGRLLIYLNKQLECTTTCSDSLPIKMGLPNYSKFGRVIFKRRPSRSPSPVIVVIWAVDTEQSWTR